MNMFGFDTSKSIVAITNANGSILGTGFIAEPGLLITCAHVVAKSKKKPTQAHFQFDDQIYTAEIIGWQPAEDIALLQIEDSLIKEIHPLPLSCNSAIGHPFSTFGYPEMGPYKGIPATGSVDNIAKEEIKSNVPKTISMYVLDSEKIIPGFSGAPVWDEILQQVVGVIAQVHQGTKTAFAVPANLLGQLCPELIIYEDPHLLKIPCARNPNFVGRERQIKNIEEALSANQIVIISGMDGIGKTQLAARYAQESLSKYMGGIYWVSADQDWSTSLIQLGEDTDLPLNAFLKSRGISITAHNCLRMISQNEYSLLIFDNIEDPRALFNPAGAKMTINENKIKCHVLVTSQRHNPKSREFDNPKKFKFIRLRSLPGKDALSLLEKESGRTWQNDAVKREKATKTCEFLGKFPLALAIAGAYLRDHPRIRLRSYLLKLQAEGLKTVDTSWSQSLLLPTGHAPEILATLQFQWKSLKSTRSQRILKTIAMLSEQGTIVSLSRLALFTGLPSESEEEEGPPFLEDELVPLRELSLIEEAGPNEIRLSALIREYAKSQEECNKEMIENLRNVMNDKAQPEVERRRAALMLTELHWFDHVPANSLKAEEMLAYLELIKRSIESDEQRNHLIEKGILPALDRKMPLRQRAALLNYLAGIQAMSDKADEALDSYQKADALLARLKASKNVLPEDYQLAARINQGMAYFSSGAKKIEWHQKALQAARTYGKDPILEANILNNLSFTYSQLCEWNQAEIAYQTGIEVLQVHLRAYADILETASQMYDNRGNRCKKASMEQLTNYEAAYQISTDEINLLERASLIDTSTFVFAHINAADSAIKISQYSTHSLVNPIKIACNHLHAALPVAIRLGMDDDVKDIKEQLDQYYPRRENS